MLVLFHKWMIDEQKRRRNGGDDDFLVVATKKSQLRVKMFVPSLATSGKVTSTDKHWIRIPYTSLSWTPQCTLP